MEGTTPGLCHWTCHNTQQCRHLPTAGHKRHGAGRRTASRSLRVLASLTVLFSALTLASAHRSLLQASSVLPARNGSTIQGLAPPPMPPPPPPLPGRTGIRNLNISFAFNTLSPESQTREEFDKNATPFLARRLYQLNPSLLTDPTTPDTVCYRCVVMTEYKSYSPGTLEATWRLFFPDDTTDVAEQLFIMQIETLTFPELFQGSPYTVSPPPSPMPPPPPPDVLRQGRIALFITATFNVDFNAQTRSQFNANTTVPLARNLYMLNPSLLFDRTSNDMVCYRCVLLTDYKAGSVVATWQVLLPPTLFQSSGQTNFTELLKSVGGAYLFNQTGYENTVTTLLITDGSGGDNATKLGLGLGLGLGGGLLFTGIAVGVYYYYLQYKKRTHTYLTPWRSSTKF